MKKKTLLLSLLSVMAFATVGGATIATQSAFAEGETVKTDKFAMLEGASIRISEPTGLRFQAVLGETQYEALTAENSALSLHMLVVPVSYYADYQVNAEEESYYEYFTKNYSTLLNIDIPTDKLFQKSDLAKESQAEYYEDGYYYANGVIQELNFNSYANEFVGLAYLKTAGETVSYTDATVTLSDPERSAYEVAIAAYTEEEGMETELKGIIDTALYYKAGVRLGENGYFVKGAESTVYGTLEEAKTALGEFAIAVEETLTVFKGETVALNAKLLAGETEVSNVEFSYASSAENVVAVQNGALVAVGVGSAEITVTTSATYSKTVTVTVLDGNILSKEMVSYWKALNQVECGWDETENAFMVKTYATASSTHTGIVALSAPVLEEYFKLGYRTFSFKVKVDAQAFENGTAMDVHFVNPGWVSGSTVDIIEADAMSATEYVTAILDFSNTSVYENQFKNGFSKDGWFNFEIDSNASADKPSVLYLKDFAPVSATKGNAALNAGTDVDVWTGFSATLAPTLTLDGETVVDASFTYATTNANVVTVDENGALTAVGVGTANVLVCSTAYGVSDLVKVSVATSDLFSESMVNSWNPRSWITREWDSAEQALKVVSTHAPYDVYGSVFALSLPTLGKFFEEGYRKFTFEVKVDENAMANGVALGSMILNPNYFSGCTLDIASNEQMSKDGYVQCTVDYTNTNFEKQFNNPGFSQDGLFEIIIKGDATDQTPSTVWFKNFKAVK